MQFFDFVKGHAITNNAQVASVLNPVAQSHLKLTRDPILEHQASIGASIDRHDRGNGAIRSSDPICTKRYTAASTAKDSSKMDASALIAALKRPNPYHLTPEIETFRLAAIRFIEEQNPVRFAATTHLRWIASVVPLIRECSKALSLLSELREDLDDHLPNPSLRPLYQEAGLTLNREDKASIVPLHCRLSDILAEILRLRCRLDNGALSSGQSITADLRIGIKSLRKAVGDIERQWLDHGITIAAYLPEEYGRQVDYATRSREENQLRIAEAIQRLREAEYVAVTTSTEVRRQGESLKSDVQKVEGSNKVLEGSKEVLKRMDRFWRNLV